MPISNQENVTLGNVTNNLFTCNKGISDTFWVCFVTLLCGLPGTGYLSTDV